MIPAAELSVLLPCGHYLPQEELMRLAASIAGKRSAGISRGPRPGTGRPAKLSPCPKCGDHFGVVAMRKHRCANDAHCHQHPVPYAGCPTCSVAA